jgi:heme ABC exporter ATP-binding subunit CcmA
MGTEPLIHVVGLSKAFGPSLVLDDVTLDVQAGEAVALLGANGSGKTTLLKILATLLGASRGMAMVAGFECGRDPVEVRRRIGLVSHGSYVYEDLTPLENLRFWSTLASSTAGEPALRAALTAVDLDAVADERVRTLSAGMKRRLSLARVVLARPPVLLLDEPFTGLDQRGTKWLVEYLQDVKARGGAILMATHNLGPALAVADRVVILADGRIAVDRPRLDLTPDEVGRLYALHAEATS